MIKLRDGSTTTDPRLTRIPWFDPKSWEYKVSDLFKPKANLRTRTWMCDKYLDQGPDGACTGFSTTHFLLAKPKPETQGMTAAFAKKEIYWEAQKIDPFPGGSYPGADNFMEGSTVLAAMKVAQRDGYIKEYRWAFGIEDVKKALSQIGPVVLGIPWYKDMFNVHPCGMLHPTGEKSGAHALLAKGIRVKRQTIVLHNSWGDGWGNEGTAEIHWDDLAYLLQRGGEACVPTKP
jgi:hypothetical protein